VVFTLSSDAHFPDDIGKYVAENAAMLKQQGVGEIATFAARQRVMKPLQA
jgi:histidinol-phosphatase (PHP family)